MTINVISPDPFERLPSRQGIFGVLLAGGQSKRMGSLRNKLNERIGGTAMVRRAATSLLEAGIEDLVTVTGFEPDVVQQALVGIKTKFVHNPIYGDGLSTSLRAGVACLPDRAEAALISLADMPFIRPCVIRAILWAAEREPGVDAIIPTHQGRRGHPVLLRRRLFGMVAALRGDSGAGSLLQQRDVTVKLLEVPDAGILKDVDTAADLNNKIQQA